jgi:dolichol-phosphate mannosyltransferase
MRVQRTTFRRWLAFNFVGAGGIAVQLALLAALTASGTHYLPATAIAVEGAVLNNFAWHERWTWVDRTGTGAKQTLLRLARFNLSVGAISIVQNLVFMKILVSSVGLPYLAANLISIALCSLLNFLVSDRLVFR